jgi:1-acyl-sn-glycerol-3-phosphate acyltransferase
VPILPVYIPRKKTWFRRITLVFGEPYMPEFEGKKPTPEDYERISGELMSRIYELRGQAE